MKQIKNPVLKECCQTIYRDFKEKLINKPATTGSHMNQYGEWGALVMSKMLQVIIINFADELDAYIEPAHQAIKHTNKGELYKINNAPREYYKSLNPFYSPRS